LISQELYNLVPSDPLLQEEQEVKAPPPVTGRGAAGEIKNDQSVPVFINKIFRNAEKK
jgi:hypothetical protein